MIEWHEVSDERLLMQWRVERMAADQIGAWYGVEEEVVIERLNALGQTVAKSAGPIEKRRFRSALETLSDAEFSTRFQRLGGRALAREVGCDRTTVERRRKMLGLACRPLGRPKDARNGKESSPHGKG